MDPLWLGIVFFGKYYLFVPGEIQRRLCQSTILKLLQSQNLARTNGRHFAFDCLLLRALQGPELGVVSIRVLGCVRRPRVAAVRHVVLVP